MDEIIEVEWENPETDEITLFSVPAERCYPPEPEEIDWEIETGELLVDLAVLNNEELREYINEQCLKYMREYNDKYYDPPEPDFDDYFGRY